MENAQQDDYYLVVVENIKQESTNDTADSALQDYELPLQEDVECKIEQDFDYDDSQNEQDVDYDDRQIEQDVDYDDSQIEQDVDYDDSQIEQDVDYDDSQIEDFKLHSEFIYEDQETKPDVAQVEFEECEQLDEQFFEQKPAVDPQILQSMKEQDKKRPKLAGEPYLETSSGLFQCKYCRFKSVGRKSARNHFATRHCDNGYICLACGRRFKRKDTLLYHELHCTAPKADGVRLARQICKREKPKRSKKEMRALKAPCSICGKMISKNNMNFHLGVHAGVKRFKCIYCPSAFRANKTLKAHINMHLSRKPYACDQCSKSYTSLNTLQAHKLDHRGKSFHCHHCGKGYKRKHRIIEHLKTHDNDNQAQGHICPECSREFASKMSLSQHQRSHRRRVSCAECTEKFATMTLLIDHAKKEHGSIIVTRKKLLQILPQLTALNQADPTLEEKAASA